MLGALSTGDPLDAGEYEQVAGVMRQVLQNHPHGPVATTRLGMALARSGQYAAALDAFDEAAGTAYYEARGLEDHADVLRAVGRCDEAAALRLSATLTAPEARLTELLVGAVDDRARCGELGAAEALAWRALAIAPDEAPVHAALSDVLRAEGRADDAEFERLYAERLAPDDERVELTTARARAEARDWDGLEAALASIEARRPRLPEVFALRHELLEARGAMVEAAIACRLPRWASSEDPLVTESCTKESP